MRDTPGVESRSSKPKRLSTVLLQAHESKPAGKEGFRHLAELRILRAGAHAAAGVHQAKYSRSLQPVQSTTAGHKVHAGTGGTCHSTTRVDSVFVDSCRNGLFG